MLRNVLSSVEFTTHLKAGKNTKLFPSRSVSVKRNLESGADTVVYCFSNFPIIIENLSYKI